MYKSLSILVNDIVLTKLARGLARPTISRVMTISTLLMTNIRFFRVYYNSRNSTKLTDEESLTVTPSLP